ncbi:uncharacterized protein LOC129963725 [Argiope bruennichi]|uniref:Cuticle protein 14 isoform b like protein n=1 Tax=Argiope bruennichi TaxID=94029 RepID=A0A8T0EX47_ARGBR|nr:uncharacterized protein LOC129963725 [Argiope bruennichi]KAF8782301.1 Cuticle protein 14 isoform b like protein [Argiope bruennichi]
MKTLIILALTAVVANGATVYHPAWKPVESPYYVKDNSGNYAFGHHDANPGGPSFHSETGDISGKKVGSYGVRNRDGTFTIVDYVADQNGYRPNIRTSEKRRQRKESDRVRMPGNLDSSEMVYSRPFPYYYFAL